MTVKDQVKHPGSARIQKAVALLFCAGLLGVGASPVCAQEFAPVGDAPTSAADARANEVKIEDYLKSCWKEKRTEVDLTSYGITREELSSILFGIHYEEPEYYWVIRYQSSDIDKTTGKITKYYPQYTDYAGAPFDRSEEIEREWEMVQKLTENCTTDIEKALVVHDHLVRTITYTSELGNFIAHDIEGGILEKQCICEGYALAYKYYMNRLGVPCKVVGGTSKRAPHAWNQIEIDGKWYFVDATWDDIDDMDHTVKHSYFLKSGEAFAKDHIWDTERYEPCTDTTYDKVAWDNMSRKMSAYKGSLIVPGFFQNDGALKTGIWIFDAGNLTAPGELAIEISDQWQLNENERSVGCAEVSYYEGNLYYTTPKAVWKWDFSEPAKPEKVFELDKENPNQIWYIHVADGKIYYETARYVNSAREQHEYVIDKDFKKVKQPIAVTSDVIEVKVGGSPHGDFLQAAAPGTVTYTSSNPEVCELEPIMGDKSCQLHPKKVGRTTVTITAAETDHYLPATKEVTIIVTGDGPVEEKAIVSFEAGDNGTVAVVDSATKEPVSNGAKVDENTDLTYTATPARGYSVKKWIVNGSVYMEQGSIYTGTELTRTVTAPEDHVRVEFAKDPVPLQGIKLNKTTLSLEKGASEVLTVTFSPADTTDSKDVTWKSANDAVATVDAGGRVVAVGRGETVVTATSVAGGHQASCTVTVSDPEPEPEPEPKEFTVTFKLGYEGAKDPEPVKVVEGKTVPKPAADPVREGYVFKGWFNGAAPYSFDTPVTADLTLTAKWEQAVEPAPQVDKSKLRAAFDECKVLDAKDYTTMTWYPFSAALDRAQRVLKDEDATQPQVDEALKGLEAARAGLKRVEKIAFADVDEGTSHKDDVEWLAANGITKGWAVDDGVFEFRPYATVRRADMAEFLYRLAGEPAFDIAAASEFTDVDEGTPHYRAILWLASEGISTGWKLADGTVEFRPYGEITRCDMAAFLYRMAGEPELGAADAFVDVDGDTPHRKAVLWLAESGVSAGWTAEDGTKTFRPYDQIVRCDMAAFLHRMAEKDLVDLK